MTKAIKRVPLRPDTFKKLKIFCAKNDFKTYNNAIEHLLKKFKMEV